ncbi:hypothetical protein [Deinococcus koreensis]|uniref:Uncharacterized protein n=1 Tax=Deinococcus koreensis TaxID=2054903 RepID=A0A2K3URS2_9DEIO|nr:hypothetical protein [Deinococcus koreensis]PNY79217.1 hypothetical protein CVO96_20080 [Deinococcus koreensis]
MRKFVVLPLLAIAVVACSEYPHPAGSQPQDSAIKSNAVASFNDAITNTNEINRMIRPMRTAVFRTSAPANLEGVEAIDPDLLYEVRTKLKEVATKNNLNLGQMWVSDVYHLVDENEIYSVGSKKQALIVLSTPHDDDTTDWVMMMRVNLASKKVDWISTNSLKDGTFKSFSQRFYNEPGRLPTVRIVALGKQKESQFAALDIASKDKTLIDMKGKKINLP